MKGKRMATAQAGKVSVKVVPDFSAFKQVEKVDVYATIANIAADLIGNVAEANEIGDRAAQELLDKYTILPR
jgi:hypothetical protein